MTILRITLTSSLFYRVLLLMLCIHICQAHTIIEALFTRNAWRFLSPSFVRLTCICMHDSRTVYTTVYIYMKLACSYNLSLSTCSFRKSDLCSSFLVLIHCLQIDRIPDVLLKFLLYSAHGFSIRQLVQIRSVPLANTNVWFLERFDRSEILAASSTCLQSLHVERYPSLLLISAVKLSAGSVRLHTLHILAVMGSLEPTACRRLLCCLWRSYRAMQSMHLLWSPLDADPLWYQAKTRWTPQPMHFLWSIEGVHMLSLHHSRLCMTHAAILCIPPVPYPDHWVHERCRSKVQEDTSNDLQSHIHHRAFLYVNYFL